jgi:hypothetical protein
MNLHAIFHGCPHDHAWRALSRDDKRHWAIELVARAIAHIEAENREPDPWESHLLSAALGQILCGRYTAAATDVRHAFAPLAQRSSAHEGDTTQVDVAFLKRALGLVATETVRG